MRFVWVVLAALLFSIGGAAAQYPTPTFSGMTMYGFTGCLQGNGTSPVTALPCAPVALPTSGGTANAQTVTYSNLHLSAGVALWFVPGFSNTAAMTLAANGITYSVRKQSPLGGLFALTGLGNEVVAAQPAQVLFDGTEFVCITCGFAPYSPQLHQNFSVSGYNNTGQVLMWANQNNDLLIDHTLMYSKDQSILEFYNFGGTYTAGHTFTFNMQLGGVTYPVVYTVQPGDTANTVAVAIAACLNGGSTHCTGGAAFYAADQAFQGPDGIGYIPHAAGGSGGGSPGTGPILAFDYPWAASGNGITVSIAGSGETVVNTCPGANPMACVMDNGPYLGLYRNIPGRTPQAGDQNGAIQWQCASGTGVIDTLCGWIQLYYVGGGAGTGQYKLTMGTANGGTTWIPTLNIGPNGVYTVGAPDPGTISGIANFGGAQFYCGVPSASIPCAYFGYGTSSGAFEELSTSTGGWQLLTGAAPTLAMTVGSNQNVGINVASGASTRLLVQDGTGNNIFGIGYNLAGETSGLYFTQQNNLTFYEILKDNASYCKYTDNVSGAQMCLGAAGGNTTLNQPLVLGVSGSIVGSLSFANATSGTDTINPPTGALGSAALTLPGVTSVIVGATGAFTSGDMACLTGTAGLIHDCGIALPSSFTIGQILYASSASAVSGLSDVALGSVLASGGVGAAPSYIAISTGLAKSGSNLVSNAEQTITFQPGAQTAVSTNKSAFIKWAKASTVDNIEGSAETFTCTGNPTVTLYECGVSTTCAGPTTIGSATVTATGTVVDGTVSNPAITAGDYTAWAVSAGTCTVLDIAGTAQVHSN